MIRKLLSTTIFTGIAIFGLALPVIAKTENSIASDATAINQPGNPNAVTIRIAVAANFHQTLLQLRQAFTANIAPAMRPRIKISSGATGALYHQILHGAPFDILFAADRNTPQLLVEHGIGQRQSLFNYAIGRMLLVTRLAPPNFVATACAEVAVAADQRRALLALLNASARIVLANPRTAPYGRAGQEILHGLQPAGVSTLDNKVVQGRNILHAQQLFERTDADTALLSQAQAQKMLLGNNGSAPATRFNYCHIPSDLYAPLEQAAILLQSPAHDATLLQRRDKKAAAMQFIDFVQSAQGQAIIERSGYAIERSSLAIDRSGFASKPIDSR